MEVVVGMLMAVEFYMEGGGGNVDGGEGFDGGGGGNVDGGKVFDVCEGVDDSSGCGKAIVTVVGVVVGTLEVIFSW